MFDDLRERVAERPAWKLSAAAVGIVAVIAVVLALAGTKPRLALPRTFEPGAPIVSGRRPTAPAGAVAAVSRFLADYLPFLYGSVDASRLQVITPQLRRSLAAERGRITPAERARSPQELRIAQRDRPVVRVVQQ